MAGAGVQNNLIGSRLTPRLDVRAVENADADLDSVVEEIDTTKNESQGANLRGDGQTLALFVILLGGATGATLELWIYGGEEDAEGSSSSSSDDGSDAWCLVDTAFSVTSNALKLFTDMPAGRYKVMVTSITGGSGERVLVKEQHSA
jgi:hypothetical protein